MHALYKWRSRSSRRHGHLSSLINTGLFIKQSHLKSNKIVMSASGVTRSPNGSIPDLVRCKTGSYLGHE